VKDTTHIAQKLNVYIENHNTSNYNLNVFINILVNTL